VAWIVLAIVASTSVGFWGEHRFHGRVGSGSRRALIVVLYVLLPPITFFNLVGVDLSGGAGLGIVLGLVSLAVLGFLAWLIGSRLLRLSRPATGALISCELVVNTGYLGLAVVAALHGFDALGEAVAYDILVSGPGLLIGAFAVGAAFGAKAGEGVRDRLIAFFTRNPPLYAAVAALLAPEALAPEILVDASRVAVIALLPVGFLAVGATLAEDAEEGEIAFPPRFDRPVAVAVALRLIGGPLLLLGLAAPITELPDTYLLLAAMPCGLNTMIVAHAYGLDLRIAAGAIAWSTAIGVAGLCVLALLS